MKSRCPALRNFYRSDKWKKVRAIKIANANGRCEMCGGVGTEVHHIIHLTPENVSDPKISLNLDNLMLLCKDCHNKVHGRVGKVGFDENGDVVKGKMQV